MLMFYYFPSPLSDVDECSSSELNDCEQDCENTKGGFICSCKAGYTADSSSPNLCVGELRMRLL